MQQQQMVPMTFQDTAPQELYQLTDPTTPMTPTQHPTKHTYEAGSNLLGAPPNPDKHTLTPQIHKTIQHVTSSSSVWSEHKVDIFHKG